jgi:hypothetical protein
MSMPRLFSRLVDQSIPRGLLWLGCAVVISFVCSGCKTEGRPPGASDDYPGMHPTCIDRDGDGFGLNCPLGADCDDTNATVTIGCHICDHPSPGCPCATENARSQCGKVAAQEGTQTTCSYGESVCTGGAWGECMADGKTLKSFDSAKRTLGLASAVGCGIACDPYCQQFPDTPDDTLSTPQGLLGTDGGLTIEQTDANFRPFSPNGPMPGYVQAALEDGGIFADAQPDAIIYHEVPPTVTAVDTVAADTVVPPKSIDVYFLENYTGTMKEPNKVVRADVPAAGGTVDQVHAMVPDAWFGVGRFGTYGRGPWNDTGAPPGVPIVAFQHVLSPTIDVMQLTTALQFVVDNNVAALASPRTWVQALYAIATTGGLPSDTALPWVPARVDWSSPTTPSSGQGGACPAGTVGYPCFRSTSVPVTVVVTDAPSLSGPGGQYGIAKDSAWNIPGAKDWATVVPTAVTGNRTEATAQPINPNTFAIYTGDTSIAANAAKNNDWGGGTVGGQCSANRGQLSPNSYFTFTVPMGQQTWYHFDTIDSGFRSFPYLYQKIGATNSYLACNDKEIFGDPQFLPRSIDGVLGPGLYYLVVDGILGAEGAYTLHVNAMPDGGPVTAPNYDEALAVYGGIGGKVIGVDVSGNGCDVPPVNVPRWLTKNTSNSLEKLLRDTGSVDGGNNPYLISLSNSGNLCHAADPAFATKLAQDILDVTGPARAIATRADVTTVVVDSDDNVDFDGPPGGANRLTPVNVDDATFVTSITTVSTPETMANCTQIQANQYLGCLTGTPVTFTVNIQTPATITPLYYDQIFTFVVRIMLNGTTVLSEIPVVVVVPSLMPYLGDAWFVRDFDTTPVCPMGTAPVWGTWAWNASTPGDSRIDFDVSVASSATGLSALTAFVGPLQFSNTPTTLVGQAIGVHDTTPSGDLDTQLGATYVDYTLAANMRDRDSKALRIRSHLIPSTDNTLAPTLKNWNLSVSCVPAE